MRKTLALCSLLLLLAHTASAEEAASTSSYQLLKQYFIEGGWQYMASILVCMVIGLAISIERIITLNLATTNTDKLLANIEDNLKRGDVSGAMEVCKATPGPTASVLHEGLRRHGEGMESVEKAVINSGSIQMGLLEQGLIWISLFIALGPMLGFFGTVIGMVQAFDSIAAAGDISPQIVADGMKVALLTTVFGLVVAMILQVAYNYIVAKIDNIVLKMEESSNTLVDMMADNNVFSKK